MFKQTVVYKKDTHFSLEADYYGLTQSNVPVVIYIHGGGLLWGTKEELSEEMIQLYGRNGYALFSINYRLAPETKLPEILEDIADALQWIQTEGPKLFSINPKKVAIVGSSAGAFLALSTGTLKNKPVAIVSFSGYGDLTADWATHPSTYYLEKDLVTKNMLQNSLTKEVKTEASVQERFLLYLYARQSGEWMQQITGRYPLTNQELSKYSPIFHITESYPPTLFLHGTNDQDVPYVQSVFMRAALIKEHVKTKLITIPNGEHVFEKDFHNPFVQHALNEMLEFLHPYLVD